MNHPNLYSPQMMEHEVHNYNQLDWIGIHLDATDTLEAISISVRWDDYNCNNSKTTIATTLKRPSYWVGFFWRFIHKTIDKCF